MTFFFVSNCNLSNCADDNTVYTSGYNLKEVQEVLLDHLNKVTEWFFENYMVLNAGKCHLRDLAKIQKMKLSPLKIYHD